MFNPQSNYSRNKQEHNAIVYCDAFGDVMHLTAADFGSEEEFRKWKSWSDENYHIEDKLDVVERKHTVPIDLVSDAALTIPGIDVVMIRKYESAEKYRQATVMIAQFKDKLTKTQFRRLCLYFMDKMCTGEIGAIEGVSHQNISKSIIAAIKKIKKIFPEDQK